MIDSVEGTGIVRSGHVVLLRPGDGRSIDPIDIHVQ